MRALFYGLLIGMVFSAAPLLAGNSERNFGGVGIDGEARADGQIVVRQLVAGGPAQQAGVRKGDIITHIDGKATQGSNFRQMVDHRLRGQTGTRVTLIIRRQGEGKPLRITLIRRQLVIGVK